jgi:hypothetical protein
MPTVQLTAAEATELKGILENYFSELRMEIERTENGDFRTKLKGREQIVKGILQQLT